MAGKLAQTWNWQYRNTIELKHNNTHDVGSNRNTSIYTVSQ